jgi:hypothetical protein
MSKKIAVLIAAAVFGIFMLLPLFGIFKAVKLKKHGVKTEATVLSKRKSGKSSNTVNVVFTTSDGAEVTAKATERNFVKTGDKVTVWYDPAAPQNIDLGGSQRYNMRAVVISGFVFFFMIYLFIKYTLTDLTNKKLIKTGMKIEAQFVAVDRDERIKIKGQNPWIIRCSWVDSRNNQKYFFVTKPYTIDPAPYLNGRYHLDVFINPADPKKYFIDTSFMPKGDNTIG